MDLVLMMEAVVLEVVEVVVQLATHLEDTHQHLQEEELKVLVDLVEEVHFQGLPDQHCKVELAETRELTMEVEVEVVIMVVAEEVSNPLGQGLEVEVDRDMFIHHSQIQLIIQHHHLIL